MRAEKIDVPVPKTEFEAWTLQQIVMIANDVAWVKKAMWVLGAIVASALLGVKLL